MLCAQYSYKLDIAEKKKEAFQDGLAEGAQQKAEEAAINLLKMDKLSPEEIAQSLGLPYERVMELEEQLNHKPA